MPFPWYPDSSIQAAPVPAPEDPPAILPELDVRTEDGVMTETSVTRRFRWDARSGPAEVNLSIPENLLEFYEAFPPIVPLEKHLVTYATDPILQSILQGYVRRIAEALDQPKRDDFVRELVRFVQSLQAESLQVPTQFPLQTLDRKTGDCSDRTALLGALLYLIGQDFVFLYYPPGGGEPGHTALAIGDLPEANRAEARVQVAGEPFAFLETTDTFDIGARASVDPQEGRVLRPDPLPILECTASGVRVKEGIGFRVRVANVGSSAAREVAVEAAEIDGGQRVLAKERVPDLNVYEERLVDLEVGGQSTDRRSDRFRVTARAENAAGHGLDLAFG